MQRLTAVYRRVAGYLAKVRHGFRVATAMGAAGSEEFVRVGLMEDKSQRSALSTFGRAAYRVYWFGAFLIALVLAQWAAPIDGVPYFAALLALSAAWLFALPSMCDTITGIDYSTVHFGSRAFRALMDRIRSKGIAVPSLSSTDEVVSELDETLPPIVATALPVAMMDMLLRLAPGAVLTGVIGLFGLLVGTHLEQIHWWHHWTPASILFAVPAPWAVAMLASLFAPILAHTYIAARKFYDLPAPTGSDDGTASPTAIAASEAKPAQRAAS